MEETPPKGVCFCHLFQQGKFPTGEISKGILNLKMGYAGKTEEKIVRYYKSLPNGVLTSVRAFPEKRYSAKLVGIRESGHIGYGSSFEEAIDSLFTECSGCEVTIRGIDNTVIKLPEYH